MNQLSKDGVQVVAGERYYVQRKPSGYLGNAPIWWRHDDRGYSAYLENAKRFDEEKARELVAENPEKWAMYPCSFIDAHARQVFDHQDFHLLTEPSPVAAANQQVDNALGGFEGDKQ